MKPVNVTKSRVRENRKHGSVREINLLTNYFRRLL